MVHILNTIELYALKWVSVMLCVFYHNILKNKEKKTKIAATAHVETGSQGPGTIWKEQQGPQTRRAELRTLAGLEEGVGCALTRPGYPLARVGVRVKDVQFCKKDPPKL